MGVSGSKSIDRNNGDLKNGEINIYTANQNGCLQTKRVEMDTISNPNYYSCFAGKRFNKKYKKNWIEHLFSINII